MLIIRKVPQMARSCGVFHLSTASLQNDFLVYPKEMLNLSLDFFVSLLSLLLSSVQATIPEARIASFVKRSISPFDTALRRESMFFLHVINSHKLIKRLWSENYLPAVKTVPGDYSIHIEVDLMPEKAVSLLTRININPRSIYVDRFEFLKCWMKLTILTVDKPTLLHDLSHNRSNNVYSS